MKLFEAAALPCFSQPKRQDFLYTLLTMQSCTKRWEGRLVIDSFTYEFARGERIGIAGPNGAGMWLHPGADPGPVSLKCCWFNGVQTVLMALLQCRQEHPDEHDCAC